MKCKVFLSKKTDNWATPKYIYDKFIDLGYYDPCPLMSDEDNLTKNWKRKNFVNPPYSQLRKWIKKSIEEHKKGRQVVLLIPARTDTKAFKELYCYGCWIAFVSGRLRFNDANTAPFPSMFVLLKGNGFFDTKCALIDRENIDDIIHIFESEICSVKKR